MPIGIEPNFCRVCNKMILSSTVHNTCTCGELFENDLARLAAIEAERDKWRELFMGGAHPYSPTCLACFDDTDPDADIAVTGTSCKGRLLYEKHATLISWAKLPSPASETQGEGT